MTNKLALVVAVVLGVLSILGVRFYVEKIKSQSAASTAPVPVPVARRDLKFGDVVQSADVDIQNVPRAVLEVLGESYYLQDNVKAALEGRRIIVPVIRQGQVFQTYHVNASSGGGKGLKINDTAYRALTVSVGQVTGLAGMLRPGDKVDLIVTTTFKEQANLQKELKVTETLLQGVEILAIDNITDADAQVFEYTTVTFKLKQEDVNRVVFAQDNGGSLHLAKMDAGASPSSSVYPVFADTEYARISDEIQRILRDIIQRKMNQLPERPK